jgi:histidine triad (HIT) family protein
MSACLFCRIASGEVPVPLVWEDEEFVAFRDIDPKAPVHVLVVPRRHLAALDELADAEAAYAGRFLQAVIAVARQEGLADPERGFRLVTNSGPEGGQSVPHLHGHVLGGRRLTWPPG